MLIGNCFIWPPFAADPNIVPNEGRRARRHLSEATALAAIHVPPCRLSDRLDRLGRSGAMQVGRAERAPTRFGRTPRLEIGQCSPAEGAGTCRPNAQVHFEPKQRILLDPKNWTQVGKTEPHAAIRLPWMSLSRQRARRLVQLDLQAIRRRTPNATRSGPARESRWASLIRSEGWPWLVPMLRKGGPD
jgi:hypothetical protein